jgi:hypothetical protein
MNVDPNIYLSRADEFGLKAGSLGEVLRNAVSGASRIDILSGYYSIGYLAGLFASVPRRDRATCRVRLVFGVDSQSALAMAADRLKTFREEATWNVGTSRAQCPARYPISGCSRDVLALRRSGNQKCRALFLQERQVTKGAAHLFLFQTAPSLNSIYRQGDHQPRCSR